MARNCDSSEASGCAPPALVALRIMILGTSHLLSASGSGETRYRLAIKLDDNIEGFGIRPDDTVTRERRTLRARYQLIDLSSGDIVLDATAGSDAGIDVVSSEYATIAAEDTALENLARAIADQIVTRLSIYANEAQRADTP